MATPIPPGAGDEPEEPQPPALTRRELRRRKLAAQSEPLPEPGSGRSLPEPDPADASDHADPVTQRRHGRRAASRADVTREAEATTSELTAIGSPAIAPPDAQTSNTGASPAPSADSGEESDHTPPPQSHPAATTAGGTWGASWTELMTGSTSTDSPDAADTGAQSGDGSSSSEPETSAEDADAGENSEPADRPSRAGRNLPVAIGVGLGLVAILAASLFIRKEAFGLLALAAAAGSVLELRTAFASARITIPPAPILVGAAGMLVSGYTAGAEALLVAFIVTAGAVVLWCVIDHPGGRALRNASASIFVTGYVAFLGAFLAVALAPSDGVWRVLVAIGIAVGADLGGYITGVLWGKHPLAPHVSPKKSWEGLAGSVVLASIVATALVVFALDAPAWIGVVIGVLGALVALLGDLSESLIKRDLGIKDMGTLLPGHGGVLDRVDSILLVAPVATILLAYLVPVS